METLAWIGFTQSFFGALLLLAKRNNHISDKILAAWLVVSAITFFEVAISKAGSFSITPVNTMITNVLLYIYCLSVTNDKFRLKSVHFYHALLPFIFVLIIVWTGARLRMDHYFFDDVFLPYRIALAVCLIASFFLYWYLSIKTIHRYRMHLKNEYSSIESNIKLGWLLFVLIFYIIFNLWLIAAGFIEVFSVIETNYVVYILISNLFLVFAFIFYGLRQQVLMPAHTDNTETTTYAESKLSDEEKHRIAQKLMLYFDTKQPYLDRELTISSLAAQLGTQRYKLTEVLNSELHKNFYRFVNEYRIEKAKAMLTDRSNDKLSIEAIGYDCGFNSKTTFFTVFKSFTGLTPMQYKTQISGKN
ncbi:MAG TPA: helix-turn-helix domain-containing protein [Bacteroidales bacterium]|nr:helix-turn-helix domain-containing protein [Bacteroidales bacterium]